MRWLVAMLGAYLLGSVPFSYLAARIVAGRDLRRAGSGNVGTTNTLRVAGEGAALIALIGDVGKGAAAVLLAQQLTGAAAAGGLAAIAAMLGHVRPIFLRFGGGKGGATGFGALLALAPAVGAACAAVLLLVIALTRYVSVGTMATAVAAPLLVLVAEQLGWVRDGGAWLPLSAAGMAAIILVRHAPNIRRLRAGIEPKLALRRAALRPRSNPPA